MIVARTPDVTMELAHIPQNKAMQLLMSAG